MIYAASISNKSGKEKKSAEKGGSSRRKAACVSSWRGHKGLQALFHGWDAVFLLGICYSGGCFYSGVSPEGLAPWGHFATCS